MIIFASKAKEVLIEICRGILAVVFQRVVGSSTAWVLNFLTRYKNSFCVEEIEICCGHWARQLGLVLQLASWESSFVRNR